MEPSLPTINNIFVQFILPLKVFQLLESVLQSGIKVLHGLNCRCKKQFMCNECCNLVGNTILDLVLLLLVALSKNWQIWT